MDPLFDGLPEDPLVDEVRSTAERLHLAERYREIDRHPEFPRAEFKALGESRLLGLTLPGRVGGRELPLRRAATVLFHLAYLGGTTFAKLALQPEFSSVLFEHGDVALIQSWFRPLMHGRLLVGNQITEPTAGSDATAMTTVAEPSERGYRLSGTKSEAAFAADADAAIVYARAPGTQRAEGISAFVVPQEQDGVRRTVEAADLGERWQRRGRVAYAGVEVERSQRIGEEGKAFSYLRPELARERGLLAAIYLGVARASWDEVCRYAGERTTFGRRLADQPAVAGPIVEDGAELAASWLFTVRSLERLERGEDAGGMTALAKVRAVRAALSTLEHAIQFHGGSGYSSRLPHEQRWRDVRSGSIAHGPSEVLLGVAARQLWPTPRR